MSPFGSKMLELNEDTSLCRRDFFIGMTTAAGLILSGCSGGNVQVSDRENAKAFLADYKKFGIDPNPLVGIWMNLDIVNGGAKKQIHQDLAFSAVDQAQTPLEKAQVELEMYKRMAKRYFRVRHRLE